MVIETGFPCPKCATNPWTDCEHRKAERDPPYIPPAEEVDYHRGGGRYRTHPSGKGLNFKRRRAPKAK